MDSKRPFKKIIIVGAGPSGLLLALLLSQHNIPTLVLEAWDALDSRLRATQYGVPATKIFRRAGILDDIRSASISSFPSICWRRVSDHARLTGIDLSVVKDEPDRMTILSLDQILAILYRHCMEKGRSLVVVRFGNRVVGVGQREGVAWVDVEVGGEEKKMREEAGYVVGCDGGSSTVRRELFGRHWPGETFDCRLLVQNVWYDGFEKHGWDGGNYMIDPEFWGLIAKRGKGGLWRVTYGDKPGLTDDEYLERRKTAFRKLLPGNPEPSEYKITQTDQFRIHNRCVDTMRVERILLAADAAHVCNPFGGYGCMSGILDVGGLADCLVGMYEGKTGEEILDLWASVRREKFLRYVDERSRKNMNRILKSDPETVLETDKFLGILRDLEGDNEGTKAFLLKTSSIEYDFTQHYRKQVDAQA